VKYAHAAGAPRFRSNVTKRLPSSFLDRRDLQWKATAFDWHGDRFA
jgi:hypothetical protein